jgi:hypothetical protein
MSGSATAVAAAREFWPCFICEKLQWRRVSTLAFASTIYRGHIAERANIEQRSTRSGFGPNLPQPQRILAVKDQADGLAAKDKVRLQVDIATLQSAFFSSIVLRVDG